VQNAINNAAIAYTGGYETRNKFNHTHAVSYEGFGTDYAAFVLDPGPTTFRALLYNFAGRPLAGRVRFWTLLHGRYRLTLGPDANGDDRADRISREATVEVQRATPVAVSLPPRQVTVLELRQTERLDDELARADLALSPLQIEVHGNTVTGMAHNIGAADAPCEVALVRPDGKVVARQSLGILRAPEEEACCDVTPGMGQLETLCEQVREAGLPVELTVSGEVRPLASSLDLTAYRIVQESLTNTLKHAGKNLTRAGLLKAATHLNEVNPFLLPGLPIITSPSNYLPLGKTYLVRYQRGFWNVLGKPLTTS
jgi:hypothetical protein